MWYATISKTVFLSLSLWLHLLVLVRDLNQVRKCSGKKSTRGNDEISVSSDKRLMICGNPLEHCQHAYARAITCHVNCSRLRYVSLVPSANSIVNLARPGPANRFGIGNKCSRFTFNWTFLNSLIVIWFGCMDFIAIRDAYRAAHKPETFHAASSNNHTKSKLIYFTVCHSYNYNEQSICAQYKAIVSVWLVFFCFFSFRLYFYVIMILWMFGISHKCNKKQFAL